MCYTLYVIYMFCLKYYEPEPVLMFDVLINRFSRCIGFNFCVSISCIFTIDSINAVRPIGPNFSRRRWSLTDGDSGLAASGT